MAILQGLYSANLDRHANAGCVCVQDWDVSLKENCYNRTILQIKPVSQMTCIAVKLWLIVLKKLKNTKAFNMPISLQEGTAALCPQPPIMYPSICARKKADLSVK